MTKKYGVIVEEPHMVDDSTQFYEYDSYTKAKSEYDKTVTKQKVEREEEKYIYDEHVITLVEIIEQEEVPDKRIS